MFFSSILKKDSLLSEPAILIKNKSTTTNGSTSKSEQILIELDKFENNMILLREAYSDFMKVNQTVPISLLSYSYNTPIH